MKAVSIPARAFDAALLEKAILVAGEASASEIDDAVESAVAAVAKGPKLDVVHRGGLRFLAASVGAAGHLPFIPIVLGGSRPLSFAVVSGALPGTASMSADTGVIEGTTGVQFNITIEVTDDKGNTAQASVKIDPAGVQNLPPLTLSNSTIAENIAAGGSIGSFQGQSGSTFALVDTNGNRFAQAGNELTVGSAGLDYEDPAIVDFGNGTRGFYVDVEETNADYDNSPLITTLPIVVTNIYEAVAPNDISLSANTFELGTASSGTVSAPATGWTLDGVTGAPAGLTIDLNARTWDWDGTGSAESDTLTFTQTHPDAAGPHTNDFGLTINVAAASPTVQLSAAISQNEGDSGTTIYTYTVTRSDATGAVSVPWAFSAGTTSADDFVGGSYPAGGTVDMADGVLTGTIAINVQGDTTVESDEDFTVSISAPAGYALGSPSSATGTILNDDSAPVVDNILLADNGDYFTNDNGDYLEAA